MNDKKKKIIIGCAVAVVVVLVCALCYFASSAVTAKEGDNYTESSNSNESSETDTMDMTTKAQQESEAVPEDEQKDFDDIDVDEYLDLYDGDENSIVLLSRPTCGYCQIAEPILHHIAYQYDLTIYHINTDEMNDEDSDNLINSDDFFSDGFGTPLLLVVSNGEIVDMVSGLVDTDSYVSFFTENGFIKE